jgi:hypothetical protein
MFSVVWSTKLCLQFFGGYLRLQVNEVDMRKYFPLSLYLSTEHGSAASIRNAAEVTSYLGQWNAQGTFLNRDTRLRNFSIAFYTRFEVFIAEKVNIVNLLTSCETV